MLRKIYLAVECANDQEKELVQQAAQEISEMRVLTAKDIIKMQSVFMNNRNEIVKLFRMISQGGVGSLLSVEGMSVIRSLMKRR